LRCVEIITICVRAGHIEPDHRRPIMRYLDSVGSGLLLVGSLALMAGVLSL